MGVGSEAWVAVDSGRNAIGCELKESYFRQAVRNLRDMEHPQESQLDWAL